ncbi:hypothetical protein PVAND_015836 [Polypedilum vanderplanki]|uniref:Uncharacterized protein n=1 Tax=Polypedilum vanderplanki TaxID=319348 RepID=A0A9J6BDP9_POLVA|nr:hypothetical protein PVAND_015836 [Polypedilum vanderplanki]
MCYLQNNPLINSPNSPISAWSGSHLSSMSNTDVTGFCSSSDSQIINYMPELNKIFPNLVFIYINIGRIKEIHRTDFEQYLKLTYLDLDGNDITYLEKSIFELNTKLQVIRFEGNKIQKIYPTVFDHLNQLQRLLISGSQCMNGDKSDRSGVLELIKEIKKICWSTIVLENFDKQNIEIEMIKEQFQEKFSKIVNLDTKAENMFKMMNNHSKMIRISESNMNNKIDSNERVLLNKIQKLNDQQKQYEANLALMFKNLETSNFQQFFFIALPLICLFTTLNLIIICLCCRKHVKFGKKKIQKISRNDFEMEERNCE